jgi:hypothetical protein
MKKYFLSLLLPLLWRCGLSQMVISPGANWVVNGNATVVLNDMNLVNEGTIAGGTGSFKFTGTQNATISGSALPMFNTVEVAKTGGGKLLLGRNIHIGSSISFISGQLDLNNNNIMMPATGYIAGESETNRIIGPAGGFVEITQNLNAPAAANPGNLGATISSSANLGDVIIRRGHVPQSGTGLAGSIQRYYYIMPQNNSNLNATLRLKYFDAELNSQNENILVIYQSSDNGANWTNLSQTTRNTNANYVEKTGVNSLSLQTLSNDVTTSGVTGLVFTGKRKKATEVELKWTTQTETNMSGYEVQRRLDNEADFTARAWVATKAPGGNSTSQLSYLHIDPNAYTGTSYYRLKIVDQSNNVTWSPTITVAGKTSGGGGNGGGNPHNNRTTDSTETTTTYAKGKYQPGTLINKITVGPNPNNGNFWFTVSGIEKETAAELYTLDGKLMKTFKVVNQRKQYVSGLRSGLYLLKVQGMETVKVIVQGGSTGAPVNTTTESYMIKN